MPKKMEQALLKEGKAKHLDTKRLGAYVYGTMRKTGWTPSTQKKKGKSK